MKRGELFLHGLRLVENEIVAEHHENQKNPQMDFFHLNIIKPSMLSHWKHSLIEFIDMIWLITLSEGYIVIVSMQKEDKKGKEMRDKIKERLNKKGNDR